MSLDAEKQAAMASAYNKPRGDLSPRQQAAWDAFAILTAYLGDECPDGENWEDFDSDIDEIRFKLDEILNQKSP